MGSFYINLPTSNTVHSLRRTHPRFLLGNDIPPQLGAYGTEWYNRVLVAGGSSSMATLNAVDTFVTTLVNNGIYNKIYRCNLFCGDVTASLLIPIINFSGSARETSSNFVAADYNPATGLLGNGSNKYLNTGLNPNAAGMNINSCHLSAYVQSGSLVAVNRAQIGCDDGPNGIYYALNLRWSAANDSIYYSGQNAASNMCWYTPDPNTNGCYIGSRTATTSAVLYRNGGSVATATAQSKTNLPPYNILVFAQSDSGTPIQYVNQRLGGYTIGSGLTAADATVLNNAYTAFATARS